ncbi:hypothetical protein QNI19_28050 [Cytophagaceae bacterium DM2B3-1]|uniref:Peptidase C39-like domain-containing protein n=1 Tax=Xanthocytophaga flava TaxID=3048013 RepID=A0ABT7CV60_9BACT|nr:hypothetical protein [Xanthocytophaga flavus]MDJ1496820.1 hypothetical protein [Xanthocytophaga flavus]
MNHTKQTDWFDIKIDDLSKIITVTQRWAYKWACDPGEKAWTTSEEKLFARYPALLINSFWKACPKIRVRGNSSFAKENSRTSFQLRFQIEQTLTHPILGNPHWNICIYRQSTRIINTNVVNWYSREVTVNLSQPQKESTNVFGSLQPTAQSHSVFHQSSLFDIPQNYFDSHSPTAFLDYADQENRMNTGLTLRELNFVYLVREMNRMFVDTSFYSDFSTEFDFHSILTRQIVTTAPTVTQKTDFKRISTSPVLNSKRATKQHVYSPDLPVNTHAQPKATKTEKEIDNGEHAGSGGNFHYINYDVTDEMVCQEHPMSCVQACVRQLLKDAGINTSEKDLTKASSFSEQYGTDFKDIVPILNELHPNRKFDAGSPAIGDKEPEEIAIILTKVKKIWIARLKPTTGPAHSVIVDGIENNIVTLRDPWGNGVGTQKGAVGTMTLQNFCKLWTKGINYSIW